MAHHLQEGAGSHVDLVLFDQCNRYIDPLTKSLRDVYGAKICVYGLIVDLEKQLEGRWMGNVLTIESETLFCSSARKRSRFSSAQDMMDGTESERWLLNVEVDGNIVKVHIDPDCTFAALAALLEKEGAISDKTEAEFSDLNDKGYRRRTKISSTNLKDGGTVVCTTEDEAE